MISLDDIKNTPNILQSVLSYYGYVSTTNYKKDNGKQMMAQTDAEGKVIAGTMKYVVPGKGTNGIDVWYYVQESDRKTSQIMQGLDQSGQKSVVDLILYHENFNKFNDFISFVQDKWSVFQSSVKHTDQSLVREKRKEETSEQKQVRFKLLPLESDSFAYLRLRKINPETAKAPIFENRFGSRIFEYAPNSRVTNFAIPFLNREGKIEGLEARYLDKNLKLHKISLKGSNKTDTMWYSQVPKKVDKIMINEAPLDHLAYYELHALKNNNKALENTLYMSTLGSVLDSQKKMIDESSRKFPKAEIILSNDNDLPGNSFNIAIMGAIRTESNPFEMQIESRMDKPNSYHTMKLFFPITWKHEADQTKLELIKEYAEIFSQKVNKANKGDYAILFNGKEKSDGKSYFTVTIEGVTDVERISKVAKTIAKELDKNIKFIKAEGKDMLADLQQYKSDMNQILAKKTKNQISM